MTAQELAKKYKTLLNKYKVNTPLRLAHLFGQAKVESDLKPVVENMNYSAVGLTKTFSKYFPTMAIANKYAHNPIAIANKVYANRMGNGDEESGDGYNFRGKGLLQITGKENYKQLSKDTEIDFLNNPDLLLDEASSMVALLWFWQKMNLNALADKDDCLAITKKINGGTHGYDQRLKYTEEYKEIFK